MERHIQVSLVRNLAVLVKRNPAADPLLVDSVVSRIIEVGSGPISHSPQDNYLAERVLFW